MPYVTLKEGERYIKPIDQLFASADDGMTQDDLDHAEEFAKHITDGKIGWAFDISDWEDNPPPLVNYANELIASGKALDFYLFRDTNITLGEEFQPDKLQKDGMDILNAIADGDMELVDESGDILDRLILSSRQGFRHRESPVTFYPDRSGLSRFSAERTIRRT